MLLPIATGHDRRKELPYVVLDALNQISMSANAPLSLVTEYFGEAGGLSKFNEEPTMIDGVRAAVFDRMFNQGESHESGQYERDLCEESGV